MSMLHMDPDQVSQEANGYDIPSLIQPVELFSEVDLGAFLANTDPFVCGISGECTDTDLIESIGGYIEQSELDQYFGTNIASDALKNVENHQAIILAGSISTQKQSKSNINKDVPIPLSGSVGISSSGTLLKQSHEISIENPLEETFRPRYKSDYFTQSGIIRKPRYVADKCGNHFISLRVPLGISGYIRVDWLTIPTETGDRYVMPYKFQSNNESQVEPDCNPLHVSIEADGRGLMKLYLVLIKSKQDELKSLQPLKPFQPFREAFGLADHNSEKEASNLTPKKLIQKYQLDKSQLAFTYCRISTDGQTPIPEWETTVFSTVLTESSPAGGDKKFMSCPNCKQSFQISSPALSNDEAETIITTKRKQKQVIGESETRITIKKQRSVT